MRHSLRLSILVSVAASVFSGGLLFWTSQAVQTAEDGQQRLQDAVAGERETIRVLQTEWAYLTRPDRLEELARTHLRMTPPELSQFAATVNELPQGAARALPARKPALRAQDAVFAPAAPARPPAVPEHGDDTRRDDESFQKLLGAYGAPEGEVP